MNETKKPMRTGDAITMLRSGKLKSNKRYFAKPDTWFKEGTEAFYEEEIYPVGTLFDEDGISHGSAIYRGTYVIGPNEGCDTYWHSKGYKEGDEVEIREHCCNSEFIIIEEKSNE